MAVSYNRHRQKLDFSRPFDYKRNCRPEDSPESVSVKYVNKRCSPEHIHKGNSLSPDQNTITITVKKKNIQQRKPAERAKIAPSLITISDYLKVLAKKCSTPDINQTYVLKNQKKMRCSDTCVNNSTPFRTKTIVNTVSLDPKKVPADCKNFLNHPLMQAQLSIYRCQLKTEKVNVCRTCNSTAIFEVVKCLYDCYKKKKCDPCKCVVCGYLPKDIRKLINEVGRSSVSIGVETPTTNKMTKYTMTSQEDELLSMLQSEQKQEKQSQLSVSEKLRIAKAFGILTPPLDVDREPYYKENNTDYTTTTDAPCLDDDTELDKWLYRTNVSDASPSIRVPSKKLRKARASGLLTSLDGKTQEQREKMLRHLAMNDIPLPEGKTESEKRVITKVRRELGLPPGPTTFAEKEKYAKAQAAGIITPLKGKSQPQKENILRTLLENGIPLPEGRTAQEKALIEKIELDCLVKPKSDTEKTTKCKARSYVHTLFNKFANEAGYMVLVETSCIKDRFHNLQVAGLAPLEGEASVPHHIWPKDTKSIKALFKEVEKGGRLILKSQVKIKLSRRTEKERTEHRDGQVYSKKSNKRQLNSGALLEEIMTKSKETRFAVVKNALSRSRTSLENLFEQKAKDKARASNVVIERTHKAKGSKSESEQVKGLAEARLLLKHDYVPLDKEYIYKFRDKPNKVLEKKTYQSNETGNADSQKINRVMVTKLISKLVSHIKEDLDDNGARAAIRERDVIYKIKKPSYRNSYLTINLSVSDGSDETRKKTRSVFTDTKDIKYTSDIATSVPSIPNSNSTEPDEAETPDKIPTKEIKKKRNKRNANTKEDTSNSPFYFHFDSDDADETANQSDNYERDYKENADLFYIYKPNFDVNAKGMLTASSRIILTDTFNISPATSGSLYLIETGSTDSYDGTVTDFSYATKDTSETETGTDVFYLQLSDDELSKDTDLEPRIYWFYRNRVVHDSPGKDAKIYLVSEVKTQQRNEPLYRRCNNNPSSRNQQEVMQAGPGVLRRTSSVFIVFSPTGNDECSSEEAGSLIYVEKLDSIPKLKNIKFVRHENTQKLNPIKMCRRHTRNEEKVIKHCIDSKTLKCPENSRQTGSASHKLPTGNAFTNHPCNVPTDGENKLEYSKEYQKQRIPPKYSYNQSMTAGGVSWEKELAFKLSSCSTTCRLGLNRPENRIECSGKQRMEPKNFEIRDKEGPECGNNQPPFKNYTRYLYSSKLTSHHEKETKCNPDHRLVTKNSKVCLISTAHSSRYSVRSKVSFSDELKYIVQGKLSGLCREKNIYPESSMKDPPVKPKECRIPYDSSSYGSPDEKEKRARKPQFKIEISPKLSDSNLKSDKSSRESKVHFDSTLSSCCPCEKKEAHPQHPCAVKKESKRCDCAKKAPQSDSDLSNEESKSCDSKKEEAQQDPSPCKKQSRPCDKKEKEKKENNQCKDQQAVLKSNKCKIVTEESSKVAKNNSREPGRLAQTSDDKQCSLSQARSSQCRETVKRATSPLNVDMKSVGVDSSCSKPNDAEESRTGCREKIPKKPQKVCGSDSETVKAKEHTRGTEKLPNCPDMQTANENLNHCQQTASVLPPLNSAQDCLKTPQCPASNTTDSTMQSTGQCIKQQTLTAQLCPPSATQNLTEQPTDECIKINQKKASECAELNGNDKLNQQMTSECPANSTQNSKMQPAKDNANLNLQTASVCPANLIQASITQPTDDNAKLNEQTASECPAILTADSTTRPVDNNAKLNEQAASECQKKCTEGLTNQPSDECAKQQIVKSQLCPPNSIEDPVKSCLSGEQKETDICPKSQKKKNDGTPCESYTSKLPPPPATAPVAQSCPDPNQADQKQLTQQSDSHEKRAKHTCDSKNKKYGRVWWCRKKQVLLRHPDHSPSSVEENTAETQCERDVKDLAQMTDDLLENAGDLEQCRCGGTVKPCQCLLELAETISSSSGHVTSSKPTSDCKCSQPLILRGQNELNGLGQLTEQKSNCSCLSFIQENNIQLCQCNTEQSSKKCQSLTAANQNVEGKGQKEQAGKSGGSNVNMRCACRGTTVTEQTCPSVKLVLAGKKKVTCECPHPILTRPTPAGKNEAGGTCQSARPILTIQTGTGPCRCMMPRSGSKKNNISEYQVPKPIGQAAAGQNDTCGTGQPACPGPTAIVKEHTTGVQCQNRSQRSCDDLAKVDPSQGKEKSGTYKKTLICESPSKDTFQGDRKAGQKDHKKRRLILSMVKKKIVQNGDSSDDDDGCQKKCRVKWSQKKYVISECPPMPSEGENCPECTSPEKKKGRKKNAKNQAKIKTEEKKVDTSCTHGATPCLCKDKPLQNKNHKCECPCPLFVEEVDLSSDGKKKITCECPVPKPIGQAAAGQNDTCGTCQGTILGPTFPSKEMKKDCDESDRAQVTEDKKDKCSYTDRRIKNICKTKNKASGHGKWGKKKKECICLPEPPMVERGCDPPCVKEQWRMRSQETCSKSGFSVAKKPKKPAPRVDYTMCFEEALAYFEQHPEDDPMRKRKNKTVVCECPPPGCGGLRVDSNTAIPCCL